MAVDAGHLDIRQGCGALVDAECVFVGDAELVFLEAGRNVRMRLGIDVRIDAQADRRLQSERAGDVIEAFELGRRFDVESYNFV